jgi:septum site-determining protein MinC
MQRLLDGLRGAGVCPVALGFGTTETEQLARSLDLPLLSKFRAQYESATRQPPPEAAPAPSASAPAAQAPPAAEPAQVRGGGQVVLHPVRSGQQIYAQQGDLTVCAGVGAGAEVIADGSIHVYGALRGRALAGAQGNESARIFCREFHAELVAVAGQYKVLDELPGSLRGKPAQIWLEDGKLRVAELG